MTIPVKIRKAFLIVLVLALVSGTILVLGTTKYNTPPRYDLVQLDKGWTITRGTNTWRLESMELSSIGIANKGDVMILKHTLPYIELSPATITFKTILSSVKVYVDDELIYSFGEEQIKNGRMMPKMEHFVQLPQYYSGKTMHFPAFLLYILETTTT